MSNGCLPSCGSCTASFCEKLKTLICTWNCSCQKRDSSIGNISVIINQGANAPLTGVETVTDLVDQLFTRADAARNSSPHTGDRSIRNRQLSTVSVASQLDISTIEERKSPEEGSRIKKGQMDDDCEDIALKRLCLGALIRKIDLNYKRAQGSVLTKNESNEIQEGIKTVLRFEGRATTLWNVCRYYDPSYWIDCKARNVIKDKVLSFIQKRFSTKDDRFETDSFWDLHPNDRKFFMELAAKMDDQAYLTIHDETAPTIASKQSLAKRDGDLGRHMYSGSKKSQVGFLMDLSPHHSSPVTSVEMSSRHPSPTSPLDDRTTRLSSRPEERQRVPRLSRESSESEGDVGLESLPTPPHSPANETHQSWENGLPNPNQGKNHLHLQQLVDLAGVGLNPRHSGSRHVRAASVPPPIRHVRHERHPHGRSSPAESNH